MLDTPPSRNALDFLDAPDRLTQFLEGRALQVFLRPAGLAGRIVGRGTGVVFWVLKRVTGMDLLQDLSVFFRSLGGMIDGFKERAEQVNALLADKQTTFLLVTSPEREPIEEAIFFWRKLKAARMPFGGVIVNRVHHDVAPDADAEEVAESLEEELGPKLAAKVAENFRDYHVLARRDEANIERLARKLATSAGSCSCPTSTRTCTTSRASRASTASCSPRSPSARSCSARPSPRTRARRRRRSAAR